MMEAHSHPHHGDHAHAINRKADRRYLGIALALLLLFMCGEVAAGIVASSLALIADAGHMLTDAGAIVLALFTMRLADKPPAGQLTFGLKRAEILSAQANGITLLLLALWFVYEAAKRLVSPPEVSGSLVLWVALVGIVINLLATWSISKANRQSLNVEGSFQHILTDLYAFIATAVAGVLIMWTGFNRIDSLVALLVAYLMARAGYGLVKESGRIFLEAAPRHLAPGEIGHALAADADVAEVHDLHVWEVTSQFPSLSAHIVVRGEQGCRGDCHRVRLRLEHMLAKRFHIHHTTLQVDHHYPIARFSPDELRQTLPNNHP